MQQENAFPSSLPLLTLHDLVTGNSHSYTPIQLRGSGAILKPRPPFKYSNYLRWTQKKKKKKKTAENSICFYDMKSSCIHFFKSMYIMSLNITHLTIHRFLALILYNWIIIILRMIASWGWRSEEDFIT